MPLTRFRWFWPAWLLAAGCTTAAPASGRYVVSVASSQFYKYGPAQAFGPDFALARGQKVTMVNRQFGYSQVRTDDGQSGYIATEELKPAPPEPKAKPIEIASTTRAARHKPEPERKLDLSDVPLPELPTSEKPATPKP